MNDTDSVFPADSKVRDNFGLKRVRIRDRFKERGCPEGISAAEDSRVKS